MKRTTRTLTAAICMTAALATTTLTGASTAQAAVDTTGPVLVVQSQGSYVVGQQAADSDDEGGYPNFLDPTLKEWQWTASDESDICGYSVDTLDIDHPDEGHEWNLGRVDATNATTGHVTFDIDNYFIEGHLDKFRVNAYDCAGNVTSVTRDPGGVSVVQDYGPTIPDGWRRTTWVGAIGDSMLKTSVGKVSLSKVVHGNGAHVALIMAKGPARGKAAIYFDGHYVKTIDTYAPANINRIVMWDKELQGTSNHTIKIVNLATPGRPRIDIDAYLG